MNAFLRTSSALLLLSAITLTYGQLPPVNGGGGNNTTDSWKIGGNNSNSAPPPPPGQTEFQLQNLLGPCDVIDPLTGKTLHAFRPMTLNLDSVTMRDLLEANGVDTHNPNLIVQTVRIYKITPFIKCNKSLIGRGAGLKGINNNFDKRTATNVTHLDDGICALVFKLDPLGTYCLGDRALLYSNPGTIYCLQVQYVIRLPDGRISAPETRGMSWTMKTPTIDDIKNIIEFFVPVAAGVTQKPKITSDVQELLYSILDSPEDDLTRLLEFETAIAFSAVDFGFLADAEDARFLFTYLIDSDEEPIGCLLIEMANSLLFH